MCWNFGCHGHFDQRWLFVSRTSFRKILQMEELLIYKWPPWTLAPTPLSCALSSSLSRMLPSTSTAPAIQNTRPTFEANCGRRRSAQFKLVAGPVSTKSVGPSAASKYRSSHSCAASDATSVKPETSQTSKNMGSFLGLQTCSSPKAFFKFIRRVKPPSAANRIMFHACICK